MVAQTGSIYVSGTMTDSIEISTMTSSRKCSQMSATTTNYGTVLQYCFQLRIAAVHVSMQSIKSKCENDIIARLCADEKEKREYYCYSMSVYGGILSSDIYSVARVISISGLGNHIATSGCRSSSHSSQGTTFFLLVTVEKPRFAVGISTLSTLVVEI